MNMIDRAMGARTSAKAQPRRAIKRHSEPLPDDSPGDSILDAVQDAEKPLFSPPAERDRPRKDPIAHAGNRADARAEKAPPAPKDDDENSTRSEDFDLDFNRLRKLGFITPSSRRSRVSEEFRLIKRRLMKRMTLEQSANRRRRATRNRGREHVILVTSSRPNEGKSFVALNLALSIVLDEALNVLLVDADALRPSVSRIMGLPRSLPGLTDILGNATLQAPQHLLREKTHPLTYLPAGRPVDSATDLFGGDRMRSFVADIAERYTDRIIIFDAPPLLASTEPVVLAQHVGQIVMVVDADATSRGALESALDLLGTDENVNLVLNKTALQNRSEQFGSYYDSYAQDE